MDYCVHQQDLIGVTAATNNDDHSIFCMATLMQLCYCQHKASGAIQVGPWTTVCTSTTS